MKKLHGTCRKHRAERYLIGAVALCATSFSASLSSAHDLSGALGDLQDVFNGCITNGQMFNDLTITPSMFGISVQNFQSSFYNGDPVTCEDYTWFSRPLYNRPNNNVRVDFGGPNVNGSAHDCQHTALIYGVFKKFTGGNWSLISLGMIYGKLEGTECTHSFSAANVLPSSTHVETGEVGLGPWTSVYGGNVAGGTSNLGEIRIAVFSWVHNDTRFGHPGNVCGSIDCYFPSSVSAW